MEGHAAHNLPSSLRDYAAKDPVTRNRVDDVTSTVFVIDDDISVRESLEWLIRTAGWKPEGFASAEEFLAHPRGTIPCCLIVDLRLPGLSGLELQQRLEGRFDMPIVFVSGQFRRADDCPGDEGRCGRIPHQAVQRCCAVIRGRGRQRVKSRRFAP